MTHHQQRHSARHQPWRLLNVSGAAAHQKFEGGVKTRDGGRTQYEQVKRAEYLVNSPGWTAQKRVTGGRWRRIVLGHVLAEHVVVRGGSPRLWPQKKKREDA